MAAEIGDELPGAIGEITGARRVGAGLEADGLAVGEHGGGGLAERSRQSLSEDRAPKDPYS